MKIIVSLILILSFPTLHQATMAAGFQSDTTSQQPKIGQKSPWFESTDVRYYEKKQITSSELRNKWLLLDFFTTGCSACFRSFSKMDELYKKYETEVQFLFIGLDDGKLPRSYESYRKKLGLTFPVAYDRDRSIFNKFGVYGVPHIVLIDPVGNIRAILNSISSEIISEFIAGREPDIVSKPYEDEIIKRREQYDPSKLLLIENNGGQSTEFLFRSVLTTWKGDIVGGNQNYISNPGRYGNSDGSIIDLYGRVQVVGFPLRMLYNMAFGDTISPMPLAIASANSYGSQWREPLLKVTDSSEFSHSNTSSKNLYNYSLSVPRSRASASYLQQIMQADLQNYFGYKVTVVERDMPYWKIQVIDNQRRMLMRKSSKPRTSSTPGTGFRMVNQPVKQLIQTLYLCFPEEAPFVDETDITGNISITVDALLTEFEEVKESLQRNGIVLQKGKKPMKVILIEDPLFR